MLAELAVWLGTPVPWHIRRLGLLGDSVRLWSRGRRRAKEWADHEACCHAIVRQAMAGLQRHDTVIVLGSGLARDFPLAEISARFSRVILVDAVHLLPVRLHLWWKGYRNVHLATRDLTGMIAWITGKAEGRTPPLPDLAADPSVDLVISANVLSQLALPVEDWLERHAGTAEMMPDMLLRRIVDWHLEDLSQFKAPVCLLTDTGYRELASDGQVLSEHDLLHGRTLPRPDAAWDWHVAPKGEMAGGVRHVHHATGHIDFKAA